jgi:PPK2 family polyphosphate:nucleotide phosphotransferase
MARGSNKASQLREKLIVRPGRFDIGELDAGETYGFTKETAAPILAADLERLTALQERLWAERKRRVLIVLQGMDASGKDGVIRHVMTALHPLGCRAQGFGVPSEVELAHDYLWRVHHVVPANGEIVIFNRSHYEDVLVVRVHSLVPKERWAKRYDQINAFEQTLADEGTTILKFFINIDQEEQLERFKDRLDDPTKRWKFRAGDLDERALWKDYMAAYEDALRRCSTDAAPWFAIPGNRKWFRDLAIARIVADAIEALDPQYPVRDDIPADLVLR